MEVPVQEIERREGLVRPHVQGKRVLLVSNRVDAELGKRLTGLLGCKLTVKEATNTRLDAAAKQIAKGTYDLVLSLTGFQVHGTDLKLQDACGQHRASGTCASIAADRSPWCKPWRAISG